MSTQSTKLTTKGFCDWKHASVRLSEHGTSKTYLKSVISLAQRRKATGRIDRKSRSIQETQQVQYWRKILRIIVNTIKFIAELAFQDDNEIIGSPRNGNFLGILEFLA